MIDLNVVAPVLYSTRNSILTVGWALDCIVLGGTPMSMGLMGTG